MAYIELVVLENDFDKTIDLLGKSGWIEIKRREVEKKDIIKKDTHNFDDIDKQIIDICNFLDLKKTDDNGELKNFDTIKDYFQNIYDKILPYIIKRKELIQNKNDLENSLEEVEKFKNLNLTKKEIDNFNFIHSVIGNISNEDIDILRDKLKDRIIVHNIQDDLNIIFTSKKGRWSLESEIKKLTFKEVHLIGDENILPKDLFIEMESILKNIETEIKNIDDFKNSLLKSEKLNIIENIKSFNLQKIYSNIYQNIDHSEAISLIEGFIIKKRVKEFTSNLSNLLGEKFSFSIFEPEEVEEVKNGTLKVPVLLENFDFIKPFENIVLNYGVLPYRSVDPTIFVALSFLMFFGMMYGDMGQGLIIFLIGLFLNRTKKYKEIGYIISSIGIFSIIFGFLYGTFFCFEHEALKSVLLPIDKALFGINRPYIIDMSPENSINIFLITISFGFFVNLLGILINIINHIIRKKFKKVIFSHNGVAGFIMLLSILLLLFEIIILKKKPDLFFLIIIPLSILLIFLHEPLTNLISNEKKLIHEKFTYWAFLSFVEIFELILNTISNNISFIRIGAFAFAHSILSHTTIMLVEMVGGIFSVGGIIILIIGNLIIVALEAMIVGIQTIRLEYYEFFSKFFMEQGRIFNPFKINKNIGGI